MRVGATAGGDQNVLDGDSPLVLQKQDRMGVQQFGARIENRGVMIIEPFAVKAFEPCYLLADYLG